MSKMPLFIIILALCVGCNRQPLPVVVQHSTPYFNTDTNEVDSLLLTLTWEEKIGQLIIYQPVITKKFKADSVYQLVNQQKIGGLLFQDLSLESFIDYSDTCRALADIPLFFGTEENLSLFNQFSGFKDFPNSATLSSLDSLELWATLQNHFLKQQKALGINLNLSPSLQNTENSTANFKSTFFDNKALSQQQLLQNSLAVFRENQILSIGDNFGKTQLIENDSLLNVDSIFQDFQLAINAGIGGFLINKNMLEIDSFEKTGQRFIQKHFQKYLNFNGLTVSKVKHKEDLPKMLFAGTDLFITENANQIFDDLAFAFREGLLSNYELNTKVRKILLAKKWMNDDELIEKKPQPTVHFAARNFQKIDSSKFHIGDRKTEILDYFNNDSWPFLAQQVFEKSVIIANNHKNILPYSHTYKRDFKLIQYSKKQFLDFKKGMSKYAYYSQHHYPPNDFNNLKPLNIEALRWSTPIILLDNYNLHPIDNQEFISNINQLSKKAKTVLVNFGNPYNLEHFDSTVTMIQIFERNDLTELLAAEVLFGAVKGEGKLPTAINDRFDLNENHPISIIRMEYARPEEVGMRTAKLVGIDAIARSAIDKYAAPGCQVLVAKEGKVIYSKAFGSHTYQKRKLVNTGDLYDLASITKVASTTLSAMKLYEAGKLDINSRLKANLDLPETATVGNVSLKKLFTHSSGLQAHMPIGKYISRKDTTHQLCNNLFCTEAKDSFSIQVANSLFLKFNHLDSIWNRVYHLPVRKSSHYKYSDVNFNLIQKVIEKQSETDLKRYSFQKFYKPLGLRRTMYNPLLQHEKTTVVPTEEDQVWRRELLQGFVHDETAALFGGVGGNAGLFSNAEDLAILFQMLLNGGYYGGKEYLKKETIDYFTDNKFGNHRGLGFDKPRKNHKSASYAREASLETFGHTGFTGTCVWVDPKHDLIFIFLSNRIHPNIRNRTIFKERTRARMHQVVYDAFESFEFALPELRG